MRRDTEFDAEGCRLRGWLALPDDFTTPVPAVVMAHGFCAVKEMYLDACPERFAHADVLPGLLPDGHFDAYVNDFEPAVQAACEWFGVHLGATPS